MGLLDKYSYGSLNLFDKVFQIICSITSEWSEVLIMLINDTFFLIGCCQKQFFFPNHNEGIYQRLIVNLTAAVLAQDFELQTLNILLKHLFTDNLFVNFLALEVLSLITSNIGINENFSMLLNFLYSVNEFSTGFFTNRSEIVLLKCFLQRLFSKLPDCHKDQIIKMFPSEECIEVWRVLEFQHLSSTQIHPLIEPIVSMTVDCIHSFEEEINEEDIVNIGESIKLIASFNSLQLPNIVEYVSLVEKFWLLNLDQELLQNNLIKYLTFATFNLAVNRLHTDLIIPKLKVYLKNKSYWILTFKATYVLLKSAKNSNVNHLKELSELLQQSITMDLLLQELQFQMLNTLHQSQPDTLNQLLDTAEPNLAHQIFNYIDSFRSNAHVYLHSNQIDSHKMTGFTHKCLQWREHINVNGPPLKKKKICELPNSKESDQKVVKEQLKKQIKNVSSNKKISPPVESLEKTDVEGFLMTDAIESLKGEVKCLMKLKKTEKLTPKNAADLRIIISQLSSLM